MCRRPTRVVQVHNAQEVSEVVRLCAAHGVPVIPFGAGSSLEGHLLAVQGGVSIDLGAMNRIERVDAQDLTATVGPGVTRTRLNDELRHLGLFFPIDPGADASLGGMCATRASGTNAVRYGTMRENVLALEVVTASGEILHTGTRARKSSAGYDLTRLMVGSEGTLGVITEVTVRLYPLPEAVSAAICHFDSVDAAVRTTIEIIQMGIPIARCELLDPNAVRAVNARDKLGLREAPLLLMEFHGSEQGVREQAEAVQALAREHGGTDFDWATTPEARTRLWAARHHAYLSFLQTRPGSRAVTTDCCVPISRLAECVNAAVADVEADGLPYFIVGHVGDGNFHMGYLCDPQQPDELRRARSAEPPAGTAGARDGRHLHRRARRGAAQAGLPDRRGRCGRRGDDAGHQGRTRPQGHHESREDLCGRTNALMPTQPCRAAPGVLPSLHAHATAH